MIKIFAPLLLLTGCAIQPDPYANFLEPNPIKESWEREAFEIVEVCGSVLLVESAKEKLPCYK